MTQTLPGRCPHPAPSPGHRLLAPGAGFCYAFAQVRVGVHGDTWIVQLELLSTSRDPPQAESSACSRPTLTFTAPGAGTHAGRGFGRRTDAQVAFGEAPGGRHLLCTAFWYSCDPLSASEPPSPGFRDPRVSVACGTACEPGWCRPGFPAARVRISPGAPGSLLHTFAAHLLVSRRGGTKTNHIHGLIWPGTENAGTAYPDAYTHPLPVRCRKLAGVRGEQAGDCAPRGVLRRQAGSGFPEGGSSARVWVRAPG